MFLYTVGWQIRIMFLRMGIIASAFVIMAYQSLSFNVPAHITIVPSAITVD